MDFFEHGEKCPKCKQGIKSYPFRESLMCKEGRGLHEEWKALTEMLSNPDPPRR